MTEDQFYNNLEASHKRMDDLFRRSQKFAQQDPLLAETVQELQTMMEELQVASEELHQKNEELVVARDEIEAQRLRYQDLFEFAPDGYLVTDRAGKILEANQAAAGLLRVQTIYLIGKPLAAYVCVEDRKEFRTRLAQLSQMAETHTGRVTDWETRLKPRKGDAFYSALTVAVAHPGRMTGEKSGTLRWMIRDISRQKQVQEALRIAKDELEVRVVDRTAELSARTEQLSQANQHLKVFTQELEKKNQELQDFAFVASHDLQEPLRKVRLFGEQLKNKQRDAFDPEGIEYLERMINAATRMQEMISSLLQYARVTSKNSAFVQTDLNQVAREALADLELRLASTGGRVELGPLPTIEADPLQMRQMLQNLIGNALKFHRPEVKPEVRVYAERERQVLGETEGNLGEFGGTGGTRGDLVEIVVVDNGIGIETEYLKQIFHPFERLHSRNAYDGTGMGLTICRKIAERHSGWIRANSTPGEGTVFRVTLPVRQENQP